MSEQQYEKPASDADSVNSQEKLHVASLDEEEAPADITLVSSDNQRYTLPRKAAMRSKLVQASLSGGDADTELPLPNVKGATLEVLVKYLVHFADEDPAPIAKPLKSNKLQEHVSQFEYDLVQPLCEGKQEGLFDLVLGANYMDIKPALDLACAAVAAQIKGKTPDQIREKFHITKEEEEKSTAAAQEEVKEA